MRERGWRGWQGAWRGALGRSTLAGGLALATLAACSSGPSVPPGEMAQAGPMEKSPYVPGTLVWKKAGLDPSQYSSFIIGPPSIYQGADADFGGATQADKQQMAQYMDDEFRRALGERYRITTTPGPHTATLNLTLVGLSNNVPVAATVSRIAPVGIVANVARAATDQPPSFSGTATVKGDIVDSTTGQRLATFVSTAAPKAIDLGATLSSQDAQQAAIDTIANNLRDGIARAQTAQAPVR